MKLKQVRTIMLVVFAVTANVFTVYTVISFLVDMTMVPEIAVQLMFGSMGLSVVAAVACIALACSTHKQVLENPEEFRALNAPILVYKLVMIPYFVLVTVLSILMVFASSVLTISVQLSALGLMLGMASLFILPILSIMNYLYVLATSSFSISAIVAARQKGMIKSPVMVAFIILQLLPVADVISYIFIVAHFSRATVDTKPAKR